MAKRVIGIDLGTTNSVVAVIEGGEPTVIVNQEGSRIDAVGRRVRQGWRAPRRPGGQAPGRHESRADGVLRQAVHGPEVQRGARRGGTHAVRRRRRSQRRCRDRGAGQPQRAAGDLGGGAAQAEGGGRGLSRRTGDRRGHDRARLLQRCPAAGDEGRRAHRRPERRAHHQRAHRGRARLWPRQEGERDDCRLRPRRRHVRHLDSRGGRWRRRGEVHERRHAPRRGQPRRAGHRLDGAGVPQGAGHRPEQGPDGAPAPARSGREGQD